MKSLVGRRMFGFSLLAGTALCMCVKVSFALASPPAFYATGQTGHGLGLFTIDPTTTDLTPLNVDLRYWDYDYWCRPEFGSLTYDPSDGLLYATGQTGHGLGLFTIDPTTTDLTPLNVDLRYWDYDYWCRPEFGSLVYVPEPSTIVLLGVGTIGLLAYAWRRRKR